MYQSLTTRNRVQNYLKEYGTTKRFFAEQSGVDRANFIMFVNAKYDMGQRSLKLTNDYMNKMTGGRI